MPSWNAPSSPRSVTWSGVGRLSAEMVEDPFPTAIAAQQVYTPLVCTTLGPGGPSGGGGVPGNRGPPKKGNKSKRLHNPSLGGGGVA